MFEAEVKDGRVEVPEGCKVRIERVAEPEAVEPTYTRIGINESDWDDSPEGIEKWIAWMNAIEPVEFREPDDFDEAFKQYNLEAVRTQMFGERE